MLISLNWIKEFVEVPSLPANQLGETVTLSTAEVDGVKLHGSHLQNVVVGEIKSFEPHPNADKLRLVDVAIAEGKMARVVCGAPNVRVGIKVAYAPVGTAFPQGFVLEPKMIRGVPSAGMLCSASELEIGEDADGIIELAANVEIGTPLAKLFAGLQDTIIEIDNKSLTHRPDLWGHYGFAREFSTIFRKPLRNPFDGTWTKGIEKHYSSEKSPIVPEISGECSCLGYYGISIKNVKVGPSPDWMQNRLRMLGLRPINNMVDIGNYVMLELGMPMHIFDSAKIREGRIVVHALKEACTLDMLDGSKAELVAGDTVVADPQGPLVLAGIMGGEASGVSENTENIFIEVANWKPAATRRTSKRLGLRTDSSMRYEKSLDSALMHRTALRAIELVLQLCPQAKVVGKLEYAGAPVESKPLLIETSANRIAHLLGKEVPQSEIVDILSHLDFKVSGTASAMKVQVPSYRATKDIECEADLVEEVGRIVGYGSIVPKSPANAVLPVRISPERLLQRKVQDFMVMSGRSLEVMTYPLVGKKLLQNAKWHELCDSLSLLNFWSADFDRMRPSLIPSLLEAAALNQKSEESFRLFEVGRAYVPSASDFSSEREQLGIAFFDRQESCFGAVLNVVDRLLSFLNVPAYSFRAFEAGHADLMPANWIGRHPLQSQEIVQSGKVIGVVSTISPSVTRNFKIRGNLTIAVVDLAAFDRAWAADRRRFVEIPKFPSATFDCTVVAGSRVPVAQVLDVLKGLGQSAIAETKVVSVFELPEEKKAVSVRSFFRDPTRTLSGEEIKKLETSIVDALNVAGYPLR